MLLAVFCGMFGCVIGMGRHQTVAEHGRTGKNVRWQLRPRYGSSFNTITFALLFGTRYGLSRRQAWRMDKWSRRTQDRHMTGRRTCVAANIRFPCCLLASASADLAADHGAAPCRRQPYGGRFVDADPIHLLVRPADKSLFPLSLFLSMPSPGSLGYLTPPSGLGGALLYAPLRRLVCITLAFLGWYLRSPAVCSLSLAFFCQLAWCEGLVAAGDILSLATFYAGSVRRKPLSCCGTLRRCWHISTCGLLCLLHTFLRHLSRASCACASRIGIPPGGSVRLSPWHLHRRPQREVADDKRGGGCGLGDALGMAALPDAARSPRVLIRSCASGGNVLLLTTYVLPPYRMLYVRRLFYGICSRQTLGACIS